MIAPLISLVVIIAMVSQFGTFELEDKLVLLHYRYPLNNALRKEAAIGVVISQTPKI